MDYIGVDEYYLQKSWPFNSTYPLTLDNAINAWQPIVDQLNGLHMQWNKNVIFTEIGYCVGGCGGTLKNASKSQYQMAVLYNSTYIVWSQLNWFKGLFWWNWITDNAFGGMNNSCMTPQYKPCENIIRMYYDAIDEPPPPPNYPPVCQCWL